MTQGLPRLHQGLEASAAAFGGRVAVEESGAAAINYSDLNRLADRVAVHLRDIGIKPGDRVGLHLPKTIDSVAALFGVLKAGAAYVPVDVTAPAERNAYILSDCGVRAVFLESAHRETLLGEMDKRGAAPAVIDCGSAGGGHGLVAVLAGPRPSGGPPADAPAADHVPEDLAYILYTSGSTGRPKGVMISHENAALFVDWGSRTFAPTPDDRFSSHAPFHFDLSIFDIYVSLKHGATLVLIGHDLGKDPVKLSAYIAEKRLTIWYSTPSILTMLVQFGRLERQDLGALRMILFAGEVFPVAHLRRLKAMIPAPRCFNLYGPTETNVCTYYEIPATIPEDQATPFPIGTVCDYFDARLENDAGDVVPAGESGELLMSGPGVTAGYWNLPDRNAAAFRTTADGRRWYRTGDVAIDPGDGCLVFVGRRDRMVKRRGYRVELGEIEAALYRHPDVREAAVLASTDEEMNVKIRAFVSPRPGAVLSIIAMKSYCMGALPAYMIPDLFAFPPDLPKTSTDKIDYQRLKEFPLMDFSLTDEQKALRKEITRFAKNELNAGVVERDRNHEFPRELWKKCGAMGLTGLPVPAEYGGLGLDGLGTALALEAFGYGCEDSGLAFSVCAHLLACVVPIWRHGSEELKQRYLPSLCDGTTIAVNAMSEPGSGSDAFAMTTRAVPHNGGFRLNGTKTFASNAPVADVALVFAMTDPVKGYHGGVTAFVVETASPGVRVGQTFEKMGLRTSPIGELVFDDCDVPAAQVLGQVGTGSVHFTEAMDWERVCLFATHIGTMERLLEQAIEYARTRRQYGQAIGKFQAISHRIADMKVDLEAARLLVYRAAWRLGREKYMSMDASIAKLFVSESLVRSALATVQVFGGYGFMTEYQVERALRDAVGSTLYSGTSEIQRNIIARWLGL